MKSHTYLRGERNGFGISPYMCELMVYAGHMECYAKSHEILEHFTTVSVSPSQVYRVTDYVSESLKEEDARVERTLPAVSSTDTLYVEIDGSMICTREEDSWKEAKLARLFKGSDCLNPNSNASYLTDSQYVAHLGKSSHFGEKLGQVIDSYGHLNHRLIFLTDGAPWIREWIADYYPFSCPILDFFHAMEHLYQFADHTFAGDSSLKKQWCDSQKEFLLDSKVETVIENIGLTSSKETEKKKLITYYQNNKRRMRYKEYRLMGCGIIGSGAIESAHRTVIQKRMKLSGQRWSIPGAENMLRLRVIAMNKQWAKVIDFLKYRNVKCAA